MKRKKGKFLKWLLKPGTIIGLLILSFLIGNNYYEETYIAPKMIVAKEKIQQEFDSIHILPGSIFIKSNQVSKAKFTYLIGEYTTNLSSDEFCKYYSEEAKKNGWILKRDRILENSRDLEFLKDEFYLNIAYNLEPENHYYAIILKWEYDGKDKNYLIPK